MILPLVYCAALLAGLFLVGIYRRVWLLPLWLISFLVFPTAQTKVGEAPIYLYDLMTGVVLFFLAASGDLKFWPRQVPRWQWWFIGAAFLLSVVGGLLRYGWVSEILWIWGHTSMAWVAFAFGVVICAAPQRPAYHSALQWGFLSASVVLAAIAVVQYADLPGSDTIAHWFYGAVGSEQSVEILRRGRETFRANGPHFAPTTFAGVTLLSLIAYWLLTGDDSSWRRWLVLALASLTILCTVSRHVILAAAVGLVVLIGLSEVRKKVKLVAATAVAGLILCMTTAGIFIKDSWASRFAKWDQGVLADDNVAARVVWGPARLAEFISSQPLVLVAGTGLDAEKLAAKSNREFDLESGFVSNGFLLALYYLGVGGFALYALFWCWALRLAWKSPRRLRAVTCSGVVMAIIIVAADNYGFLYEPAVCLLFLIVGLVAGQQHFELPEWILEEQTAAEKALSGGDLLEEPHAG